jgi:MFS family permease
MGLMTILGNAASFGMAAVLLGSINSNSISPTEIRSGVALYYILSGLVLSLGAFVTVVWVHEARYEPYGRFVVGRDGTAYSTGMVRPAGQRLQDWLALWLEPWQKRDFTLVFLTRTSVMLGIGLFMTFIEYYFANVAQVSNFVQETAALAVLALGGAASSAFVLGILSDRVRARLGRVPLVCGATFCMSLAALAFVVFPAGAPLWPIGMLFGVGLGAYYSVDWALAVDVLPSADSAGKDMGIWSIATTLPGIIAPFVGAIVLNIAGLAGYTALGYRVVFILAVALLLLGAVWVLMVRNQLSSPGVYQQESGSSAGGPKSSKRPVRQGWRLAFQTRSGRARGFLRFWPFWESVTIAFHPQHRIPDAPSDLLRIQFTHFHGRAITLPDGTSIRSGDRIAELHINNTAIAEVAERVSSWQLLRMLMGDLQSLARWSQTEGFPKGIHAFYGYTLLSRGASRLGFTLRSRPRTLRSWLDGFFMLGLLVLYSPLGRGRLLRGTTYGRQPVEVWMSRDQLALRYSVKQ